jgi:hypothetical protein
MEENGRASNGTASSSSRPQLSPHKIETMEGPDQKHHVHAKLLAKAPETKKTKLLVIREQKKKTVMKHSS